MGRLCSRLWFAVKRRDIQNWNGRPLVSANYLATVCNAGYLSFVRVDKRDICNGYITYVLLAGYAFVRFACKKSVRMALTATRLGLVKIRGVVGRQTMSDCRADISKTKGSKGVCVAFSVVATWAKKDSFRRPPSDFPRYPAEDFPLMSSPLSKIFAAQNDVANIGFQMQSYVANALLD